MTGWLAGVGPTRTSIRCEVPVPACLRLRPHQQLPLPHAQRTTSVAWGHWTTNLWACLRQAGSWSLRRRRRRRRPRCQPLLVTTQSLRLVHLLTSQEYGSTLARQRLPTLLLTRPSSWMTSALSSEKLCRRQGTTAEYGAAVDDGVAVTSGANKSTLPSSAIIATHAATHYELRMKATIFSHWKLHNTCGQKMNRS